MSSSRRALKPGIYVPLPTFFDDSQELDLASYGHHLKRMCKLGMGTIVYTERVSLTIDTVPVCAGSLGEAVHLVGMSSRTGADSCRAQTNGSRSFGSSGKRLMTKGCRTGR